MLKSKAIKPARKLATKKLRSAQHKKSKPSGLLLFPKHRLNAGLLAIVALIIVGIGGYAINKYSSASATPVGWLHTSGTHILLANGTQINFTGVGIAGMDKGQGNKANSCGELWKPMSSSDIASAHTMGFNSLRLAVSWANIEPTAPTVNPDGSLTHHWNTTYLQALDTEIATLKANNIMVILDMHETQWSLAFSCHATGMPSWLYTTDKNDIGQADCEFFSNIAEKGVAEKPQDGLAAVWKMLASRYASDSTVAAADMFNEPKFSSGSCTTADLAAFYEKIGHTIQSASPNILLVYEDDAWQSYMAGGFKLTRKPNLTNAVYSWHMYPDDWSTGEPPLAAHLTRSNSWNVPLFIGEFDAFGEEGNSPPQPPDPNWKADTTSLLKYFKQNNINWTIWSFGGVKAQPQVVPVLAPYMMKWPPTATPTPTPTPTKTPTPTPTPTKTPTPTPTPTKTPTPTPTPTPSGSSVTLGDSSDTYVSSDYPNANYGSVTPLLASSSVNRALLRFHTETAVPAGRTVTGAKLKLYVTHVDPNSGGVEIHPEDGSWIAASVTWNTQPAWDATVLATSSTPSTGTWVTIDLPTSAINAATATNFGLRYSAGNSGFTFASREDATHAPVLVINYR